MGENYDFYKTASPDRYQLLKQYAKEMRNNPTEAEAIMWLYLCNNQLGVKFRRQHIIGDYIVDFVSLKTKLVIEIDGAIHNKPAQKEHDEERTEFLNSKGYHILRFNNEQVISEPDQIIKSIENLLNENRI